jgi:sulfopyruvate decarboxylase subunit alpha
MAGEIVPPKGSDIIAQLKQARVEFIAALPDITTSNGLLWPISKGSDFKLIRVSKEDEGISICAGLHYCDKRAVMLMQNTGFFDSINSLRVIAVEYQQPVCMVIGMVEKEPDKLPSESKVYGTRILEPMLDLMGIDRISIEGPEDVPRLAPAIERAYAQSRPLAALVGRRVAP